MTAAFPLLRLPYLVLMPILEQMEFMERIALSVLSKRARTFVKLLKMKCEYITLKLNGDRIEMIVFFENSKELTLDMYVNEHPQISLHYNYSIAWWPGPLSPMDYVLPIMDVTHCKSIKKLIFPKVSEYNPKYNALIPLLKKLPKIDELIVKHTTSWGFSPDSPLLKVLRIVLPVSSAVTISDHVRKPEYLREIFKGNFDSVSVSLFGNIDTRFPLNDWKFTNAKTLKLDGLGFKVEDLNQYFKLWMKKTCNPRLEYLEVGTRRWLSSEVMHLLLDGLNAVQVPIRTDSQLQELGNIKQLRFSDEKITSEFDLTRADGKNATIRISNYGLVSERLYNFCIQYASFFRIGLSLLSKRARMFVKLLKMKCEHINLKLNGDRLEMTVVFNNSEELKVNMYINRNKEIGLKYGHDYISRWPCTLTPIDYVLPIMDVTHCSLIKHLTIARVTEYDTLSLLAKLPKIDEVHVKYVWFNFNPDSQLQDVLRIVLPVSSAVTISVYADKPKYLREIFQGNFDAVTVREYRVVVVPNRDMMLSPNDLRMTNAKMLSLPCTVFTLKDLNRYFKLWMKKKCNDRLEYLEVATGRWVKTIKINKLLKGLSAVQIPIRTDKTFRVLGNKKQFNSEDSNEEITSEFDITRADGRQATIRISDYGTVCFYVWPESTKDTTNHEPNQSSFTRKFSRLSSFYNSFIERFK
ncbi:hypothetical protein CRE_10461 [Caenorhabditis remanei]|uniref:F-box domain-containing protein n=1 Tax=Caenorhabditis remanei TaxID=31234 RepID=E3N0M3_CAERE|nr:hypothetical protein CRE_10461 [Caenorhabditis remanei]